MGTIKDRGTIVEKTVLFRVNFRVMGNSRKVDTKVLKADANSKLLKIQKTLLESKELAAIIKADGQMRQDLYRLCLPYDMGIALLPRDLVNDVESRCDSYRSERKELVKAFIEVYPQKHQEMKEKLQILAAELNIPFDYLYNPKDYPDADYIAGKFGFDWDFFDLVVPDELKLAGKYEEKTAELNAKIANVSEEITLVMRQALLDLVSHLKTSLEPNADGKPKRLFATAVTNIQDFLDTLKARNITNDVELEKLAEETKKLIHPNLNADMLKKDEDLKNTVHDGMSDIASKLSQLVEVIPGRKFRGASSNPVEPTSELAA